jgi:hypothetical protein
MYIQILLVITSYFDYWSSNFIITFLKVCVCVWTRIFSRFVGSGRVQYTNVGSRSDLIENMGKECYKEYNNQFKWKLHQTLVGLMVFNATFNNILVIWVEETGLPGENHWPVTSPWHNVVSRTPSLERSWNSQLWSW